ncbi:hypothetical protein G6F24_015566 [Rhizopus arrhizus]|nr:hypothetical protein G6F24_015566 [Rhizopus arrhizus]
MRLLARHGFAIEGAAALFRDVQAGQHVEQRGLARAVRADQRVQFARRDIQRHPVGRGKPAEAAHQFAGCQRGGRGHRSGRHTDASLTSALLAWAFWAGACPAGHSHASAPSSNASANGQE